MSKKAATKGGQTKDQKIPKFSEKVDERDWTGAMTLLDFEKRQISSNDHEKKKLNLEWTAQCSFHNSEQKKTYELYNEMMTLQDQDRNIHCQQACCLQFMGKHQEAQDEAKNAPESQLKTRVLFHVAQKLMDEDGLISQHQSLSDTTPNQLCLAAIHQARSHFEEATDIYKRLLLDNREHIALNVQVALCQYKLDYQDVSLEILQTYLSHHPHSLLGLNLKACNYQLLYNGKAAEAELRVLQNANQCGNIYTDSPILRHNLVVFRNGENALQVLPPLVETLPEAKYNLIVYQLKNDEIEEAYSLIQETEPSSPKEQILKAVVFTMLGQSSDPNAREHLRVAQQLYRLVGASASEADTIPGRQCMASCFFLLRQFEDVLVYLTSIKPQFATDDDFNWNFGIACAATGDYKQGEEGLSNVQSEKQRADPVQMSWLARCFIMNGKPALAWDLYISMETNNDSFSFLQMIANDCQKMGHFYQAMKAFDVLDRIDSDDQYWCGKRGAAIGLFQQVLAKKESKEKLHEAILLLKNSTNPQVEQIIKTFNNPNIKW